MTCLVPVWTYKMLLLKNGSKCVFPQANIDKEDMVRTT